MPALRSLINSSLTRAGRRAFLPNTQVIDIPGPIELSAGGPTPDVKPVLARYEVEAATPVTIALHAEIYVPSAGLVEAMQAVLDADDVDMTDIGALQGYAAHSAIQLWPNDDPSTFVQMQPQFGSYNVFGGGLHAVGTGEGDPFTVELLADGLDEWSSGSNIDQVYGDATEVRLSAGAAIIDRDGVVKAPYPTPVLVRNIKGRVIAF